MKQNGQPHLVDVETLGEALALSRARVYDLLARRVLPRAGRGSYDLVRCTRAYVEYLREERGDADAIALRRVKVERAALELEIRRREAQHESDEPLVPVADAVHLFGEAVQAFYAEVLRVSNRVAPRLASLSRPAVLADALDDELRAALTKGYNVGLKRLLSKDRAA